MKIFSWVLQRSNLKLQVSWYKLIGPLSFFSPIYLLLIHAEDFCRFIKSLSPRQGNYLPNLDFPLWRTPIRKAVYSAVNVMHSWLKFGARCGLAHTITDIRSILDGPHTNPTYIWTKVAWVTTCGRRNALMLESSTTCSRWLHSCRRLCG